MAYYGYKPAEQAIQIGDNTIVSADIADGSIVNADVNSSAAIAMSKTQLAAGTGITLSTNTLNVDAAQTQITSVGTIGTGVWNGTAIASAYLDADTAHLSGTQTFSGAKTFSSGVAINSGSANKITHNHGSTALEIENQGSKRALYVHSNVDDGQDNPLVEIKADNPAFDQEVLRIHNDGANHSLQVLDDGRLTDSHGRVINFRNTVIIMTSNLGTTELNKESVGFKSDGRQALDEESLRSSVQQALKKEFRPEFLNRIDEIIVFNPLTENQIEMIVEILESEVRERLKERNITFQLTSRARKWLTREGYDPFFGARPLRRAVQRFVEGPLSKRVLSGEFKSDDNIKIDVKDNSLTFKKNKVSKNKKVNRDSVKV